MALSPPKASSAGLRALHAANSDTTASTLIHAIVTDCTRWIRRIASGEAICSTEAIGLSIIAPWSSLTAPLRERGQPGDFDIPPEWRMPCGRWPPVDPSAYGIASHQPSIERLQQFGRRAHIPLGRFAVASICGDNWHSAAQWRVKWKEHGLDT